MTNTPLVSVLMTVYKRKKYIAEAIESVIASTYKNWELIIVDDQSKDGSVEIAKNYEKKDKRISVYVNEHNIGDYPNRNKSASYAKGKYLKYVDDDDKIYPYGLEQLVYYMEQFPKAGFGLCSLGQDKDKIFPFQLTPKETYDRHYFNTPVFHKSPLSSIIVREAFIAVGGFTGKPKLGDYEMWHMLTQKFPIVLMPDGIVWSREHDEQETSFLKSDPMERFKYLLSEEVLVKSETCPLTPDDKKIVLQRIKYQKARSIISAIKHHSLKKSMELYKVSLLTKNQIISTLIFK